MGTKTQDQPATISAATPVVEAARDLIAERLSTVRERLRKALKKTNRRRQQIHALCCRRTRLVQRLQRRGLLP